MIERIRLGGQNSERMKNIRRMEISKKKKLKRLIFFFVFFIEEIRIFFKKVRI